MGLIDFIVGSAFRDENEGRVVVFSGDRRNRGYVVKSMAEELKIRSFLKMFYFAHFSILLLGILVTNAWSTFLINTNALGRPAEHPLRTGSVYLVIYSVVVGVPYLLLWRSYKKAFSNFVSAQDKIFVSGKRPKQQLVLIGVGLIVSGILVLLGVIWLIRLK